MSAREAAKVLSIMMSPLARWRGDPRTHEVCINEPGYAWVRRDGRFARHDVGLDFRDCWDIATLAGALTQQNVSERTPIVGTDLPDGTRFQAVLPPCVPADTASLTLRFHSPTVAPLADATKRYSLDRWNKWEDRKAARRADYAQLLAAYDSGDAVFFFEEIIRLHFNVILCGATGSGKTTMLNSLASKIDPAERLITIENALEIAVPNSPNCVRLLYSHGDQSVADVTQQDLLDACLRMRPGRILVGELRDPSAAFLYVNEVMTGHPGSPTTLHGKDAVQAATRLFNLFKSSDAGRSYQDDMIVRQLGLAVDAIIPFAEDGGKFQIGEVWLGAEAERRRETFQELLS